MGNPHAGKDSLLITLHVCPGQTWQRLQAHLLATVISRPVHVAVSHWTDEEKTLAIAVQRSKDAFFKQMWFRRIVLVAVGGTQCGQSFKRILRSLPKDPKCGSICRQCFLLHWRQQANISINAHFRLRERQLIAERLRQQKTVMLRSCYDPFGSNRQ